MADIGEVKAKLTLQTKEFTTNMAKAKSDMAGLGKGAKDTKGALDGMEKGFIKTGSAASRELDKMAKSAEATKKSMSGIQTGAGILGVGVVAGMAAATKAAASFEKQLSAIKSVSGASESEMESLSALIIKLGQDTSYSANEVGIAAEELIKAGVSMDDIMGGALAGSLDLAAAGTIELKDAAEIASTALNAFKDDGLSVAQAADILAGAANASATDVGELKYGLSAVSAVASGAGMSFEDTSTALAVFAQNGLKGSDAGTSLKTMLMNLVPSNKRARETMHELGIAMADGSNKFYDAEGKLKSLSDVTGVLREALDDLNPKERGEALKDMFGADAVRAGNILFKEGAEGIEKMASAMDKIKAADVAKTKLDNLLGAFETFKGSLETLGIKVGNEFLPVFKEIVNAGTDVVNVFSDLDPAMFATGLKAAGAAAGVALIASSAVKLGIALKGLYASMGPAGWVVLGLSALAGVLVAASDEYDRFTEVTLKNANALSAQQEALEGNISKFEDLKNRSRLSTDEFARFLDINELLNETIDPQKIAALRSEQEKLTQKSGLTNTELNEMARLNDELIKVVPGATDKISEQGNRVLESTDKLRQYNEKLKETTMRELETQRIRAEGQQDKLKSQLSDLQDKLNRGLEREADIRKKIREFDYAASDARVKKIQAQIDSGKLNEYELANAQGELVLEKRKLGDLKDQLAVQINQNDKTQDGINKKQTEIGKLDRIKKMQVDKLLLEANINNAQGNGLKQLDSKIDKLKRAKREIENNTSAQDRNNAEYQDAVGHIDSEISKLQGVKSKIHEVTGAQGGTNRKIGESLSLTDQLNRKLGLPITKDFKLSGDPMSYAQRLHAELTKSGVKNITVQRVFRETEVYRQQAQRHQGGTLQDIVPKFHSGGSPRLSKLPSHHEVDVRLLRNEMVLTEAQQAHLFRSLDSGNLAQGGGMTADQLAAVLANAKESQDITVRVVTELDGQILAQKMAKPIAKELEHVSDQEKRARGEY